MKDTQHAVTSLRHSINSAANVAFVDVHGSSYRIFRYNVAIADVAYAGAEVMEVVDPPTERTRFARRTGVP
jgi:hypothetical protein